MEDMLRDFLQELDDPAVKARYAAEAREIFAQWDQLAAECAAGQVSPHKKADPLPDRRRAVMEYCGLRVLRWIERQGAIFYPGKLERETAKRYLRNMPVVFPELVGKLSAIYLYHQNEQTTERLRRADAIIWKDVTLDGFGTLYAVGISLEAIERGRAYTQLVFLHELAHVHVSGEHGPEFHRALDHMIERFNQKTGSCIVNDYCP